MDLETFVDEEKNNVIYCICFNLNGIDYYLWYSKEKNILISFLEIICEKSDNQKIEIFTHNINFDGLIIIDFLKQTNIKIEWFIRELNIYWIEIYYLKHIIRIRCSYKIISASVEKLGNMINMKKKIFPHKFVKLENLEYVGEIPDKIYFENENDYKFYINNNDSLFDLKKISIEYCKTDVLIVTLVLNNIINIINTFDNKLINNCFSFSSLAYKIFIKLYDDYKINENKIIKDQYIYGLNAYYGGRCEVFGNPVENEIIHYFDFPGMYGLCMLEKFPIGVPIIEEKNLDINKIGFHTIKFECDDYLPFLPYKSKKLYFSNGIIVGTYWYEEILNAIKKKKCKIIDHYSSMVFEKEEFIFKEYVEQFTILRAKGIYYKLFGKNMINGLYGSFALKEEEYIPIIVQDEKEFNSILEMVTVIRWKKLNNIYILDILKNKKSLLLFKKKRGDEIKRNICYASIISAKARIKLNNSLQEVINDGGRLFYTDTDSIFAGYKTNNINKIIGEIKWSETYEDGVFITNKFYQIKNKKTKIKGIGSKKELNDSFKNLKEKFYNNEETISFSNQLNINKKNYKILISYIEKKINMNSYDKRIFTIDKKNTYPIRL